MFDLSYMQPLMKITKRPFEKKMRQPDDAVYYYTY